MKSWQRMGIVAGVAVATVMWAGSAFAAGGKGPQQRAGKANGSALRTATGTQTRQQLRDGSCLSGPGTPAATRAGDRLRLRDGSCLNK